MPPMEGRGTLRPQIVEPRHRPERRHPRPEPRQKQRDGSRGSQLDQRSHLQEKQHHQRQNTAGTDTTVLHRDQTTLHPCGQTIGGVHQPVVMQPPAEPDPNSKHQRSQRDRRPAQLCQHPPKSRLRAADQKADPGCEASDASEPWRRPWPGRQHGVENPGSGEIREPTGRGPRDGHAGWVSSHRRFSAGVPRTCSASRSQRIARGQLPAAAASQRLTGWFRPLGSCRWEPWRR